MANCRPPDVIRHGAGLHGNSPIHQFTNSPIHQFANSPIRQIRPLPHNLTMHRCARFAIAVAVAAIPRVAAHAQSPQPPPQTLQDAYRLFYNAHYEEAAALAMSLRAGGTQDLENDEVRTSALLFQLRGLLNGQDARDNDN